MKMLVNIRWNSQLRSLESSGMEMQAGFNMQLTIKMCGPHIALIISGLVRFFLM